MTRIQLGFYFMLPADAKMVRDGWRLPSIRSWFYSKWKFFLWSLYSASIQPCVNTMCYEELKGIINAVRMNSDDKRKAVPFVSLCSHVCSKKLKQKVFDRKSNKAWVLIQSWLMFPCFSFYLFHSSRRFNINRGNLPGNPTFWPNMQWRQQTWVWANKNGK